MNLERLFGNSNKLCYHSQSIISKVPILCSKVEIGDMCAFVSETVWDIGRVVPFAYYQEKTKKLCSITEIVSISQRERMESFVHGLTR